MLEETGVVVERLGSKRVKVKVQRTSACKSCASANLCMALSGESEMLAEARDKLGVGVGDKVVIAIEEQVFLKASFLVYILPLAGLFAGVALAEWLSVPVSQNWQAAGGFLGLAAGFLLVFFINKKLNKNTYMPEIVRLA